MNEKITTLIGFAQKSNKVVSGTTTVKANFAKKNIKLIIISEDAPENTIQKWQKYCFEQSIPMIVMLTKLQLGLTLGKSPRYILGITDEDFAKAILKYRME